MNAPRTKANPPTSHFPGARSLPMHVTRGLGNTSGFVVEHETASREFVYVQNEYANDLDSFSDAVTTRLRRFVMIVLNMNKMEG